MFSGRNWKKTAVSQIYAVTRSLRGHTEENQEILSRGGLQAGMNLGHTLDRSVRLVWQTRVSPLSGIEHHS
jgi:hypothetical protein